MNLPIIEHVYVEGNLMWKVRLHHIEKTHSQWWQAYIYYHQLLCLNNPIEVLADSV